jgi:hypothetical protein
MIFRADSSVNANKIARAREVGYRVELSEEIDGYLIGEQRKKLRPSERHKL